MHGIHRFFALLFGSLVLTGCVSLSSARLADNLSNAMLNQTDPEIVRTGAPAYLLLIDSLIADTPQDPHLLLAGAKLYGAYGGGLVEDSQRQKVLTTQALDYAGRALCITQPGICTARGLPHAEFMTSLSSLGRDDDLEPVYVFGTSWLGWIQANQDDWNAIAELAKAEALLQKVVDIDPGYQQGRAQLYLGVLRSLMPPALGGKPEVGRYHFLQAIEYSGGKDLMIKLEFARRYARLVFDQELHDRLLKEVMAADPHVPGLTLSNVLAQQQATVLMTDDYF